MEREKLAKLSAPRLWRVLIVDDHSCVRVVINSEPDLLVCGEAEDARSAIAAVEQFSPDLAIVDIALKKSHGFDVIRDLQIHRPKLPVLVHSVHDEELYAPLCLQFGARGYMNKGEDVKAIIQAIRTVLNGEVYLSARMHQWSANQALSRDGTNLRHPLEALSARELQVFEMLGRGLDVKEIAAQLSLALKTVELYRQRIKAKLNVNSAPAVLRAAVLWCNSSSPASEMATV